MKKALLAIFVITGFGSAGWAASSGERAGTSSGVGLTMQGTVRAVGMGNAFTAVAGDAGSMFANPAGLARTSRVEVAANYQSGLEDIHENHFLAISPLGVVKASNVGDLGALGFAFSDVNYGTMQSFDRAGAPSGEFSSKDTVLSLVYGKSLGDRVLIGVAGRRFESKIAESSAETFLADVGLMVDVWKDVLMLGVSGSNLGGSVEYQSDGAPAPQRANVGLSYAPMADRLTLATDVEIPRDDDPHLRVGGEFWPNNVFALRAGYNSGYDALYGVSLGVGLAIRDFELGFFPIERIMIDYAFLPSEDFQPEHRVSLSFRIKSF
jgi:hypothetical protein